MHLDGQPDARPPIPPHIEVWRSVREGGDTKTRKSRRTLALPVRCVEVLRKQRAQQAADRLAADGWQDTGLVFTTALGTAMDAANVRRDLRRALALVPGIDPGDWTPRELRHSFVSVLSDAGLPVEEIAQLVGHRGTTVTELVYRHQLRPVIQTGATVMDRLFAPGLRDRRSQADSQAVVLESLALERTRNPLCGRGWAILGSNLYLGLPGKCPWSGDNRYLTRQDVVTRIESETDIDWPASVIAVARCCTKGETDHGRHDEGSGRSASCRASGYQASYIGPDGVRHTAPQHVRYAGRTPRRWLAKRRVEIS